MRSKIALMVGLLVCAGVLLLWTHTRTATDPLSGIWTGDWGITPTHRNSVIVDLRWDGQIVTGAVNPGPHALAFTNASFDVRTGAVHLEIDALSTGREIHYVINGMVEEDGTLIGTWNHDSGKGNFRLIKK